MTMPVVSTMKLTNLYENILLVRCLTAGISKENFDIANLVYGIIM